jgi:feruloyl esterase
LSPFLGALSFTCAEAVWTQKLPDWIAAHARALFRGLAHIMDNGREYSPTATHPKPANPILRISLLADIRAQCAGKEGGVKTDAFLSDPRQCFFDPEVVQCKRGQDPSTCLTPAQVEAARDIYAGPHDHGILLFPGYEPGGESATGDWDTWISGSSPASPGAQYGLGFGFGCDLIQAVTNCDYLGIDLVQQDDTARQTLQPILSSVNPDLRPFKKHGGKMIQYAGWADTAIAPENGLNYYRKVTQTIGDPHGFYRIFLVPGMAHCSGGAGPNAFGNGTSNGPVIDADHDLVKALERWVEQGIAPDQFIATHYVNNVPAQGVQFQRPLCPYPERGEYVGKGDSNDAANFRCVVHNDAFDPRNIGPQRAYIQGNWVVVPGAPSVNGKFQSTPLREGRHQYSPVARAALLFQSTPLRE